MEQRRLLSLFMFFLGFFGLVDAKTRRVLIDTDVNSDDIYALLYFLKQNRSEIDVKAITISANAFSNSGHAVNHIYDVLYMMDRDDIPVGVGGEGGILLNGTILANVGGYLPLIEQGMSTAGDCRYRQAIFRGQGGFLSVDTNYGLRRSFLPVGDRHYSPLQQLTAQKVMLDTISAGPITVFLSGSHTNLAIFLMTHPHLKENIEHIYAMGGAVRSKSPFGCCPEDAYTNCQPSPFCGDPGNLFTGQASNPYAEFNIFTDPFAAYQVFHSGIPMTLVPLDATNTIPINEEFFATFQQYRISYEAEYSFRMLSIIRDTWFDSNFYKSYFMWDSFAAGVAVSSMKNKHPEDENEFAEMEYMNLTVVTSNKPYGMYDGSNPFFDGLATPKFGLQKNGVHSGHVQTELYDPFCRPDGTEKGICQDGYTKEENGTEGVRVLVATKAKPNLDKESILDREFYIGFLNALNKPQQSARLNFTSQFPYYREVLYKPDYKDKVFGKPVVFDMDMSAGDLLALIYLLKVPVEVIDIKGILVSANGWANAATMDIVYDVLHMMGRDDIPVGLGSFTAIGTPSYGCKFVKAIPLGSGGFIDSDTLFGLARGLPRSPRRYSVGDNRQLSAMEVWQMISSSIDQNNTINILTNGPLTNIADIILSDENASSVIQKIYIVGGHITEGHMKKGNVFSDTSNEYAEFNMYLDPLAAKTVIESKLDVTLIPLDAQCIVTSFAVILKKLKLHTSESMFTHHLLSRLHNLRRRHKSYDHMDIFLGEILGAVFMVASDHLNPIIKAKPVSVLAGNINTNGQIVVNEGHGKVVNILESLDSEAYYDNFAKVLGDKKQSAVIGSFDEQKRMWRTSPNVF
ncbi:hypothetical protein J5N97_008976 [Dioscorea zingiberensis]|uniref:Inosine/uridine-preferring nucleoside hydrolase domain-containing protein n=1 Tax=Dioscorea zingiberensis TaxID=325984 RepID=A0A9D5CW05_9LILI|nr:hypothetical protein J5N97_008976 [Dioscorea zingiberensis]